MSNLIAHCAEIEEEKQRRNGIMEECKGAQLSGLTFGQAIEALKAGRKVQRAGWNGKGMYLYMVEGSNVPASALRNAASKALSCDSVACHEHTGTVRFNPHIDMRTADGSICVGWLASQADMLLSDWQIIG